MSDTKIVLPEVKYHGKKIIRDDEMNKEYHLQNEVKITLVVL